MTKATPAAAAAEMRALLESLAFVGWAIPAFILVEACVPRARAKIQWRAIALACGLLAVNSAVVRLVDLHTPTSTATARVIAAWIAVELVAYWLHRAMHAVPLLWRVHRMHHRDVPLAWYQSWWIHPLDIALFAIVTGLATSAVGAPLTAAPAILVARRAWGILLHANVRWPASWLDHLVTTPAVHHRHHREDLPPANFAPSFAIVDRVFGTWAR